MKHSAMQIELLRRRPTLLNLHYKTGTQNNCKLIKFPLSIKGKKFVTQPTKIS